jgi:hypothetical protein
MPSEKCPFTTRVEPVSPPYDPEGSYGGGAGYCPRVHNDYSEHRLSPYLANQRKEI